VLKENSGLFTASGRAPGVEWTGVAVNEHLQAVLGFGTWLFGLSVNSLFIHSSVIALLFRGNDPNA
jgi:hypothetical protein